MTDRPPKRRFQPDITAAYFTPNPLLNQAENASHSTPRLPVSIQSSLLNVGMRIRKSVPEGYKTKSVYSSPSSTPDPSGGLLHGVNGYAEQLVPYCGMMKTGGYAMQSQHARPEVDALPCLWFEGDDELGGLPSSQESVMEEETGVLLAGGIMVEGGKRRRFVDDEDDGIERQEGWLEEGIRTDGRQITRHPRTTIALRPIAQARNRKSVASTRKSTGDGDFEEATFLRGLDECMEFE